MIDLQTVNAHVSRVPFFRFLNFEFQSLDSLHAEAEMTFDDRHIGNPIMEYYHGGIIASFMEATAAIAVLVLAAAAARADDMGKTDFMQGCAGCHGETAMGQGPLAEFLTVEVPDLTQLSARNDGTFPMLDVIHIIDGRTGMRPHGDPMPIWGAIFKSGALGESGIYGGAEAVARGRILSVAYYLESIQK